MLTLDELKSSKFRPGVFPADIMDDENLDANERWVLVVLFTYTNAHSNTAFPSYSTLAKKTGFTRRGVMKIIERLTQKEYIVKEERYVKKGEHILQTTNEFQLNYKEKEKANGPKGVVNHVHRGSEPRSLGVVNHVHWGSEPRSPELSIELSSKNYKEDNDLDNDLDIDSYSFPKRLKNWLKEQAKKNGLREDIRLDVIEEFYATSPFIKPNADKFDINFVNDIEFTQIVKRIYMIDEEVDSLQPLLKTWVLNKMGFKQEENKYA